MDFDFDDMAYPDIFFISGEEFKGSRNTGKNQVDQIGESNHMLVNISITELVEKVAKSGDPQAKSVLKQLLENSTVASIVGAGASALLNLL